MTDNLVVLVSAEHDTCMAESMWMEVIAPPPPSLTRLHLSFSRCRWPSVFCCRDDHGCHQRSQMKGGLYPHLCPSLLATLPLSLPPSVISHPSPCANNEQRARHLFLWKHIFGLKIRLHFHKKFKVMLILFEASPLDRLLSWVWYILPTLYRFSFFFLIFNCFCFGLTGISNKMRFRQLELVNVQSIHFNIFINKKCKNNTFWDELKTVVLFYVGNQPYTPPPHIQAPTLLPAQTHIHMVFLSCIYIRLWFMRYAALGS